MCTEYEGWSNYPTWCVNLWLANDKKLYTMMLDKINELKREENPEEKLAKWLKDWTENGNPLKLSTSLYSDLITWAIGMADYYEIAGSWLEDYANSEEDDSDEEPEERQRQNK